MSEHDANNALAATARMRALAEPVEDAKPMTFSERQARAREARAMHEAARGEGHARAMLNNPVYRAQEIGRELWGWHETFERIPELHVETATGAMLDALCAIPLRPLGMTDQQLREAMRAGDFRDGRCPHGNGRFSCEICAVQDGRV